MGCELLVGAETIAQYLLPTIHISRACLIPMSSLVFLDWKNYA